MAQQTPASMPPLMSAGNPLEVPQRQRRPSEIALSESKEELLDDGPLPTQPAELHNENNQLPLPFASDDPSIHTPVPSRSNTRRSQSQSGVHWQGTPGPEPYYPYRPRYPYRHPPREYRRNTYGYQNPDQDWAEDWFYDDYNTRPSPSFHRPGPTPSRQESMASHRPPPSGVSSWDQPMPRSKHAQFEDDRWDGTHEQPVPASSVEVPRANKDAVTLLREAPPKEVLRLPWTMWMNSNAKNHFVATLGEFVGTFMFLFFAFAGTQVANVGSQGSNNENTTTNDATGFSPIVLLYISLIFSFSLLVNVWIFFRVSGGLFNPAVTFAMLLTRSITVIRAALLLIAQLAGSIFASFIVKVLFPTQFNVRTTLSANTSLVRGVFIEAVLTAELVFTIFMLAKEKHKATFIAPVGIGLALFIGELVGVYYTGGSLNPARSFGPCVVTATFDREHWIYWVGPGVGAILAFVFYDFIKILEYEVANPGQDHDAREHLNDIETGTAGSIKEGSPSPKH